MSPSHPHAIPDRASATRAGTSAPGRTDDRRVVGDARAASRAPRPPAADPAARLAERVGDDAWRRWFRRATVRLAGGRLEVVAPSPFEARWIEAHFGDALREVSSSFDADAWSVGHASAPSAPEAAPADRAATRTAPSAAVPVAPLAPAAPAAPSRPARSAPLRGFRRLEDMVVGDCNRLAHAAATRVAHDDDAGGISPLFIHGDCGLGKTHLLQGICRAFRERHPGAGSDVVRYVTGEQFTNEYIAAVRDGRIEAFRERLRRLQLLAIDDIHFLSNKVRTQNEFLHTLDAIDLKGARVVLASDGHPRDIRRFSNALISRFLSGMVVQVETPDRATRVELVRRLAARRGLPMQDAAVEALASRCVGSVREIEGAVTKLAALHVLSETPGTPAGMVLVERLFGGDEWKPSRPIRVSEIVEAVCGLVDAPKAEVAGSGRSRRAVLGRALVAHLSREMTGRSYPEIARELGRRYHSTIHTADTRLRGQLDRGEDVEIGGGRRMPVRELVDQLRHRVRQNA